MFLSEEWKKFYDSFYKISKFQYEHFSPMILEEFKIHWKNGLDSGKYFFKLCGSGGGGFILGLSWDQQINYLQRPYEVIKC